MSKSLDISKRKVLYSTFHQKWQCEFNQECKTITWLDCETVMKGVAKVVQKLKCSGGGSFFVRGG